MKQKISVNEAAVALGVSRETITRGLRVNGVSTGHGKTFTWKEIFAALSGDIKRERARRAKAEASIAEHKVKQLDEDWCSFAESQKFFTETIIIPVRQLLTGCPFTSGKVCPITAKSAEVIWQQQFLQLCEAAKVTRKANGLRHSFCSFHFALHSNENLTAAQAGNSPAMIHQHYKGLATKLDAEKWFAMKPTDGPANIAPLAATATSI